MRVVTPSDLSFAVMKGLTPVNVRTWARPPSSADAFTLAAICMEAMARVLKREAGEIV